MNRDVQTLKENLGKITLQIALQGKLLSDIKNHHDMKPFNDNLSRHFAVSDDLKIFRHFQSIAICINALHVQSAFLAADDDEDNDGISSIKRRSRKKENESRWIH